MNEQGFTHFDVEGRAQMVDVGDKLVTARQATAMSRVRMKPETAGQIRAGQVKKGDVLAVAQVAGIQAAKRTWELIPMCHLLSISAVNMFFQWVEEPDVLSSGREEAVLEIRATVKTNAQTGVEMEALTAVSVAALTVYDMCKAVDRGMSITETILIEKSGGKSGTYKLV